MPKPALHLLWRCGLLLLLLPGGVFAQPADSSFASYRAYLAAAEGALRVHDIRAAQEWLSLAPEAHRGWEWRYLTGQADMSLASMQAGNPVHAVAFSPDGRLVAGGTEQGNILLWDVGSGRHLRTLKGHRLAVTDLQFTPSGDHLASASADSTERMWDPETGVARRVFPSASIKPIRVAFANDGQRMAVSYTGGMVVVRQAGRDTQADTLKGHPGWSAVSGLAFFPDNRRLATGAWDGKVNVWDLVTGSITQVLGDTVDHGPGFGAFNDLVIAPHGELLAGVTFRGRTHVWDTSMWRDTTLSDHTRSALAVAISSEGVMATAARDQTIRLTELRGYSQTVLHGHVGTIHDVVFDSSGTVIASGGDDGTVRIWDVRRTYHRVFDHGAMVWGVEWSPDGRRVVTAGNDQHIRLWDTTTGGVVWDWEAHKDVVASLALDGRRLLSGANAGPARLWDLETGELLQELEGHTRGIPGTALGPNGLAATASYDGTVRVWGEGGGELLSLTPEGVDTWAYATLFWPDGARVAGSWSDGTIGVWEVPSGLMVAQFQVEGDGRIGALALHPDGRWLLASTHEGYLYVWDMALRRRLHRFHPHDDLFYGLHFSPDGSRLATASYDKTVKIWDTSRWATVLTLSGFPRELYCVRFSPSGDRLAVCGLDGTVRVFDASPER